MKKTLLLIEDEQALADSLTTEFEFENYNVLLAKDGLAGLELFQLHHAAIDIIILDWMLPKLDGLGVLRKIRKTSQVPIIMLTARDYISDKVTGLTGGADDYMTKPFEMEELLARIEVALRHSVTQSTTDSHLTIDELTIDTSNKHVTYNDKIIALTQREYELLVFLATNKDVPCSRDELLDAVWGVDFDGQPNIIDVYIRNLRHKLPGSLIHTIRNQGYLLSNNYLEKDEK